MNRGLSMLCGILLVVSLSGCLGGNGKASVKGKVTCNNQPVTVGTLSFTTEDGKKTTAADINPDGTYDVTGGVVVGTHVVEYSPPFVEGPGDEGWEQAKHFLRCGVPQDFRAKVQAGENTIDIKLVPKQQGGNRVNPNDA